MQLATKCFRFPLYFMPLYYCKLILIFIMLNEQGQMATANCSLPNPFISFEELDQNCTSFYGPLRVRQEETKISYKPSEVHHFEFEGCVQIENTKLKDLTFLYAFSAFKQIQEQQTCRQYITGNKDLCPANLNYLNEFFNNIDIYNNSEQPCSECIGGEVSERYLAESTNCSLIYGDLIISNFRGIPSNIGNLNRIELIHGRLIITNNTGLDRFVHLRSLKKVGLQTGRDVAFIVKDNSDLVALTMPNLNINLKERDRRVELVNNPLLNLEEEHAKAEQATTKQAPTVKSSETKSQWSKLLPKKGSITYGPSEAVFLIVAVIELLNSSLGSVAFVQRKKHEVHLLQLPNNLHNQEQLDSLCMVEKDSHSRQFSER